jgi:hypothetical protein
MSHNKLTLVTKSSRLSLEFSRLRLGETTFKAKVISQAQPTSKKADAAIRL